MKIATRPANFFDDSPVLRRLTGASASLLPGFHPLIAGLERLFRRSPPPAEPVFQSHLQWLAHAFARHENTDRGHAVLNADAVSL
jgi:hypothetical protein